MLRGASWTDRPPALPRARNKGHAARAGARRFYASAIAATRACWAIEPGHDDKTLFRLDVWITTGAAGRWDHRRLARIRRGRFHSPINVGRADYPIESGRAFRSASDCCAPARCRLLNRSAVPEPTILSPDRSTAQPLSGSIATEPEVTSRVNRRGLRSKEREDAMHKSRYVVMNQDGGWQIRNAYRHVTSIFPSKAQALCAAKN